MNVKESHEDSTKIIATQHQLNSKISREPLKNPKESLRFLYKSRRMSLSSRCIAKFQ